MISDDVVRVKLEASERSLLDYQRRCQELREENEKLQDDNETQEHDSQVVLKFLREDAERKDELIESLKKTINQQLIELASEKKKEDIAAVQGLLDQGADPSFFGEYNYTALMWSVVRKKPGVARVVLEAGADTEARNAWGRNAAFVSCPARRRGVLRAARHPPSAALDQHHHRARRSRRGRATRISWSCWLSTALT